MKVAILLPLIAFLVTSCSVDSPAKRIEKSPVLFGELSPRHQELTRLGKIEEGMTPNAVYFAWGNPDSKSEGSRSGERFERWNYMGLSPVYHQSYYGGFGYADYYGYRGRGRHYSPYYAQTTYVDYIPYRAAWIDFQNGKVKAWQRGRE